MILKIAIVAGSALALTLSAANAQDRSLDPSFGSVKLVTGFQPDPHSVDLLAGGAIDAGTAIGGECLGNIANEPDFRVFYTAGDSPLTFAVDSNADTTLVISDPAGDWICDDDSAGSLNPRVLLESPSSGQYNIWVGVFSQGDFEDATLSISEVPPVLLDWSLDPNFGVFDLIVGFEPDPFQLDLIAGGDANARDTSPDCRGYATTRPDVRINYTSGQFPLIVSALSESDTTLIISDPDGNWICDDDSGGGLNPEIMFDDPMSGQYDIWVGTYSAGTPADATLSISEIGGGAALNWDLEPNFGAVDLAAGFSPDPFIVELAAGGGVDASSVGSGCLGYVTSSPDYRVFYDAGASPLIFSVESAADTTLIIADPDGNWFCNDDTNGLDPEIAFDAPLTGQYDIWIGTFDPGGASPATLFVAGGGDAGPVKGGGIPDWQLPPTFGEVDLAAGFFPDPFRLELTAGGDLDAATADPSCVGNVAAAPDFRLHYQAGNLPLYVWVEGGVDTTLVISDPNGVWICDDDGGVVALQPALGWETPLSGQYDIWVGTYFSDPSPATLFISEATDPREIGLSLPPAQAVPAGAPPPADVPVFIDPADIGP